MNSFYIFYILMVNVVMNNVVVSGDDDDNEETASNPSQRLKCTDIPLSCVDYSSMIHFSPFTVYRSNIGDFNCTAATFTGYAETNSSYTETFVFYNKKSPYACDCVQTSESTFRCADCATGYKIIFRVVYSKLKCKSNAALCLISCDYKDSYVQTVICFGRTEKDATEINKFLSTIPSPPLLGQVYNSNKNCPKPKHCALYPS